MAVQTLTPTAIDSNGSSSVFGGTACGNTDTITWINTTGRVIIIIRNGATAAANAILATITTKACSHDRTAVITATVDGHATIPQYTVIGPLDPSLFLSADGTRAANGQADIVLTVASGTPIVTAFAVSV